MVNRLRSLLVKALVGVFVAGVALPAALQAQSPVKRFSAEFLNWDGTESVTDLAVPGIAVYDKTLTFGSDVNTVYVTFSGTADSHAGNAEWLECTIDGTPCNP